MTSGGECVVTTGTALMLRWSASSLDMQPIEVSTDTVFGVSQTFLMKCTSCTGGVAYSYRQYGPSAGPIYLVDVACTSSDSQLLECYSRPILTHNCLHFEDAGVGCKGTFSSDNCTLNENNGGMNTGVRKYSDYFFSRCYGGLVHKH